MSRTDPFMPYPVTPIPVGLLLACYRSGKLAVRPSTLFRVTVPAQLMLAAVGRDPVRRLRESSIRLLGEGPEWLLEGALANLDQLLPSLPDPGLQLERFYPFLAKQLLYGLREPVFSFEEVAAYYNLPHHRGRGRTIGLIQLGGGAWHADLEQFAAGNGLDSSLKRIQVAHAPRPCLSGAFGEPVSNQLQFNLAQQAHAGRSEAGDPIPSEWAMAHSSTSETTLDLELLTAFAPEANIKLYFLESRAFPTHIPRTFNEVLQILLEDPDPPGVLCICWAFPEEAVLPVRRAQPVLFAEIERRLAQLTRRGVTICGATGDQGGNRGDGDQLAVCWPATSPYILACGGTQLQGDPGKPRGETVWNEWSDELGAYVGSTGGFSSMFAAPAYQKDLRGRGVPDVVACAGSHGVPCLLGGVNLVAGGTSTAAPLWASLIARINGELSDRGLPPVGFLNPRLHQARLLQKALNRQIPGICLLPNDVDRRRPEVPWANTGTWNPHRGWGSPDGQKLLNALIQTAQEEGT